MNMQHHPSKQVIVGRIGSTFGIRGWLKLHSFTEPQDNLLKYLPWQILFNGIWQIIEIAEYRINGQQLLVRLVNCETPEQARIYVNCDIAIWREDMTKLPENNFYWTDLEGLTVINDHGVVLGKIDHLFATGSNDVLVVKGTKEYLIPYLPEHFIKKVDLVNKQVIVEWDEDF